MKPIFFVLIVCLGVLQTNQLQSFSTQVVDSSRVDLQNLLEELMEIGVILRRAISYPHVLIQKQSCNCRRYNYIGKKHSKRGTNS